MKEKNRSLDAGLERKGRERKRKRDGEFSTLRMKRSEPYEGC